MIFGIFRFQVVGKKNRALSYTIRYIQRWEDLNGSFGIPLQIQKYENFDFWHLQNAQSRIGKENPQLTLTYNGG